MSSSENPSSSSGSRWKNRRASVHPNYIPQSLPSPVSTTSHTLRPKNLKGAAGCSRPCLSSGEFNRSCPANLGFQFKSADGSGNSCLLFCRFPSKIWLLGQTLSPKKSSICHYVVRFGGMLSKFGPQKKAQVLGFTTWTSQQFTSPRWSPGCRAVVLLRSHFQLHLQVGNAANGRPSCGSVHREKWANDNKPWTPHVSSTSSYWSNRI